MKKTRFSLATLFFYSIIGQSCSQTTAPDYPELKKTFEATTPCDNEVKEMLGIPADFNCEMMKWNLTLYQDSKEKKPATFDLTCTYGLAKQGTRGFMEGAKTIELKGNYSTGKTFPGNAKATTYSLTADNSPVVLSFLKAAENILHLLTPGKQLVIGGAGWSYTLNRKNPVTISQNKFIPVTATSQQINAGSDTVGIFQGRTPCNNALLELNNIPANGCQLIKCQLTLLKDIKAHTASNFILKTIYVGNGDNNIYSVTGKWKLMQGTSGNPAATVYQLEPGSGNSKTPLLLLKADDNILFFLDTNTQFLVGNEYCSYTLNRKVK